MVMLVQSKRAPEAGVGGRGRPPQAGLETQVEALVADPSALAERAAVRLRQPAGDMEPPHGMYRRWGGPLLTARGTGVPPQTCPQRLTQRSC
jgi:hypothetical protein